MIDFHSHILPGIDDGAKDTDEALQLLASLKEQGITTVVATPHYHGECSIKRFLHNRDAAYKSLKEAMEQSGGDYPEIVLGTEVAVNEFIVRHNGLDRLCIDGTNYILLEMPNKYWPPLLYDIVYNIAGKYHLKVIIAHIDRYFSLIGNNKKIVRLINMQPIFQINSYSLKYLGGKKLIDMLEFFECDYVFGTDCHNLTNRKAFYKEPLEYFSNKYGEYYVNKAKSCGEKILS